MCRSNVAGPLNQKAGRRHNSKISLGIWQSVERAKNLYVVADLARQNGLLVIQLVKFVSNL